MKLINILILLLFPALMAASTFGQDLLINPESVVFDSLNERYLVANWADGIVAVEYDLTQSHFQQGIGTRVAGMFIVGDTVFISTENLRGYDLNTGEEVVNIVIAGASLDGLTADTSGNLYAVDTGGRIFKVRLSDLNVSLFASTGLATSIQDIAFDKWNNRLIAVEYTASTGIKAVSLPDGTVSVIATPPFGYFDGVTVDLDGNFYVASNSAGNVYKFDNTFTEPPVQIASGLGGPAGLCYDTWHDMIVVPNFNAGTLAFLPQHYKFSADTLLGWTPLEVQFTGECDFAVDTWSWDFGDGSVGDGQNAMHEYTTPGTYDVTMNVTYGTESKSRTIYKYVTLLADTMTASESKAVGGEEVEVTIYARNTIPVSKFNIPVEYSGSLALTFDSSSRVGCRTEYFDNDYYADNDAINRELTVVVRNTLTSTPDLNPGYGPILKLYFSPPATIPAGRSTTISLDGYGTRYPQFTGGRYFITVPTISGRVFSFVCGDVNADTFINLVDILYLIDNLYGQPPGPVPNPPESGDVNGDSFLNLIDILYLIDFLYGKPPGPNPLC